MPGLALLALLWVLVVPGLAMALGTAIRTADHRHWVRRGRPERRSRLRTPSDDSGPSLGSRRAPEPSGRIS
jgi:hypothetical protein